MKPRDRLPLLALLWLLTAAGAGFLAAWLLRSEGGTRTVLAYRDLPAGNSAEGPPAAPRGTTASAAAPGPSSPPAS